MAPIDAPVDARVASREMRPGLGAPALLTIYLLFLFALPSGLTIGFLASLGRPSFLWGLLLAFWWVLAQLQRPIRAQVQIRQPVRYALLAFFVIVLISFAAALLRGQPPDQISPAVSALLRVVSWGGALLVAMDGIRSREDVVALARRLTIGAGLVAALGLAQFITGRDLVNWVAGIPGFALDSGGVNARGAFIRSAGTASHPLEYAVVVTGCLPLALITAMSGGFRPQRDRRIRIRWWIPVAVMMLSSLLSVSRSAIIGLAVAVIATLPSMTRAYRRIVMAGGVIAVAGVAVAMPDLFSTMLALFIGGTSDSSAQSRTNALSRIPEFIASSPWVGQGLGTFLPRYYIFDDEWALLTVEVGILGALAFAMIALSAMGAAVRSSTLTEDADMRAMAGGFGASVLTTAVLFAFFDALGFPMAGGLYFLFAGITAALHRIIVEKRQQNS